jgi:histidinol dehydrogenase
MIRIIKTKEQLQSFVAQLRQRATGADPQLITSVSQVISNVRERGDAALIEYSKKFDGLRLQPSDLTISGDKLKRFAANVDNRVLQVVREAIRNVTAFHERQQEQSWTFQHGEGSHLGQRISPLDSVGVYVPGGTAAYPSSVIMNVVPARVAGVQRIAIATPPQSLSTNPAVAATILELKVDEVYAVGGAQAIAALAYGTETIKPVDKITGPGNQYVATAKKLVFGDVGIDSIAGPSEVLIVADDSAPAEFVAADLLAQAEHGVDASAVLLTVDQAFALRVSEELEHQLATLPRRSIVEESLKNYGAIVIVEGHDAAADVVNNLAPEHLELMTRENESFAAKVRHAGAIFFGPYSPEAVGDYFAGPNHVLPTGRTARFCSALGVYDFVRRTSIIKYSATEMFAAADKIARFAEAEGLSGHARSVLVRKS